MLTEIEAKKARPKEKAYKLSDGNQMYLYVSPAGGKAWRLDAQISGKRATLTIGKYPAISLKAAREKAEEYRELIARGIDPREERQRIEEQTAAAEQRQALTFEAVAREWHEVQTINLCASHRKTILARLQTNIFPYIGSVPIADLSPMMILDAVKTVERRGAIELAHRLLQLAGRVCKYARACGYVQFNAAADLSGALAPLPKEEHRAALLDPAEISALMQAIEGYAGFPAVTYALKIMPYVFVRSLELRGARWKEIDFDKAIWTIPADRMKMKAAHTVPLSRQAIRLFLELKEWSGNDERCFPSTQGKGKSITDAGLLTALRRLGYAGDEMTIHGFRSTASTLLNEAGAYRPDVIEAALAHAERNKVRAAYMRSDFLDERREMMQQWADYLDALRGGNVQSMKDWLSGRK